MENKKEPKDTSKKKVTSRQIVAIIGIVLLVAMYVITLIAAFTDTSASGNLFAMCLFGSFAIPFLIWIYSWLYQKMKEQKEDSES